MGSILGLTTLSGPEGRFVLYSRSTSQDFVLGLYNIPEKTSVDLGINTLPEKCVWSLLQTEIVYCAVPNFIEPQTYPDSWYQGVTTFSDEIWRINLESKVFDLLTTPLRDGGEEVDAINLILDEKEEYLLASSTKILFIQIKKVAI